MGEDDIYEDVLHRGIASREASIQDLQRLMENAKKQSNTVLYRALERECKSQQRRLAKLRKRMGM